jgi:hypothetical protein
MWGHLALTLKLLWRCRVSGADYPRCRAQIGFGGNGKTGVRKAASARAGAPRETKSKEFLNVGALPLRGVSGMSIADNFDHNSDAGFVLVLKLALPAVAP